MSKAEEFLKKHGLTRQVITTNGISYKRLCEWMEQYANEVSREREEKAFLAARRIGNHGITYRNFNEWIKEQEEQ